MRLIGKPHSRILIRPTCITSHSHQPPSLSLALPIDAPPQPQTLPDRNSRYARLGFRQQHCTAPAFVSTHFSLPLTPRFSTIAVNYDNSSLNLSVFSNIHQTMAEALAVVGVVSSIVQLVDFGAKVLHRLNDFQSSGRVIPKTFQHIKSQLPILLDTLEKTKVAVENGSIREEKTKHALLPVINGCREQVESLNDVIRRVLPLASDSWRKKTTKAVSSFRQDAKVAKSTAILKDHIQTLTYYHAANSSTLLSAKGIAYHT